MKKGEIKKATNGDTYVLVKRIGKGGQAEVWKVQNRNTKKNYAYKQYKHNTNDIRDNIENLISIGDFKDKNGVSLSNIVILPITTVDCEGDAFGYIMELVDLQDYTTIKKAWCGKYPSCDAICKIIQNFARFFETIHTSYGMCYKDVNEGNIFFNPHTGDIKIIDNDNIGYAHMFTIKGTSGYMAPEVVLGAKPDHNSDKFSLAVFVYRLLVGGYPFEGPYTENYCIKNDVLPDDARKVLFGTDACFVWNPNDKRNSIENVNNPQLQGQVKFWKKLPDSVKDMFISTFATNLSKDRRAERTTDTDWREKFAEIEGNLVKCPKCGKITFSESGECFECSARLAKGSGNTTSNGNTKTLKDTGNSRSTPTRKHFAKLRVLSMGEPKRDITVYVSDIASSSSISKNLPSGDLFKVLYNKKIHKLGLKNMSRDSWTIVYADGRKEKCVSGQVVVLEKDMKVRIIPKIAQLNVLEVF